MSLVIVSFFREGDWGGIGCRDRVLAKPVAYYIHERIWPYCRRIKGLRFEVSLNVFANERALP